MTRISAKTGITAEQVNEAYETKLKLEELLNKGNADFGNWNVLDSCYTELINNGEKLIQVLGIDHPVVKKLDAAMARLDNERTRKIDASTEYNKQREKLEKKLAQYNGWFVMIHGEGIPVTQVRTVNGKVQYNGDELPFIPAYFPQLIDS